MKQRTHGIVLSAAFAGSLAASATAFAADTNLSHDSSNAWRTESLSSDRALGHVERANKLIGCEVLTSDNQRFGKIDNIVVDLSSGRILYAIIGSGGFLGAGEHRVAVPSTLFTQVPADSTALQLNVDKQKLMSAQRFTADTEKDAQLARVEFVNGIYQYFCQRQWWQGRTTANIGSFGNVHKVSDLVSMRINNVNSETIGKVDNIALDLPTGRLVYVILMPDSSLNLGNDALYAMPPETFTWNATDKLLVSDLTKDKLASAPHFARNEWADLSNPSWALRVYKHYGKQPYFEKGLEPTGRQ